MDEADIEERGPLAADAVELYHHYMGSIVMPRATFYAMLRAFGERLADRPGQPETWYAALRAALDKLRAKMAADASR